MKLEYVRMGTRLRSWWHHFFIERIRASRILTPIVVATLFSACVTSDYQGDGKLVNHGPFAAKDRYVLDLGPVDLARTGKYIYTMGNLPGDRFAIGLEIVEAEPNRSTGNRPPHSGRIRLLLETSNHEIVVSEDSDLKSWIWSFGRGDLKSFLYRTGEEYWVSSKDGTSHTVHVGVRTDEGWGTFFSPRPDIKYQLTLEVLEAHAQPRPTRLLLKGGGWK